MKRWISLLLVFAMTLSLCGGINLTAYAEDGNGTIEMAEEVHDHDHDHAYTDGSGEESEDYLPEGSSPAEQSAAAAEVSGTILSTE